MLYFGTRLLAELVSTHVLQMESAVLQMESAKHFAEKEIAHQRKAVLELAFRNMGHMLRDRIGSVTEYFDTHNYMHLPDSPPSPTLIGVKFSEDRERSAYQKAKATATAFSDLCLVLQLWGFPSITDFWYGWEESPEKKERFFKYDGPPLDLAASLSAWSADVVDNRPLTLTDEANPCVGNDYEVRLQLINGGVGRAILHRGIHDPQKDCDCRLGDKVLHAFFWEMFLNAARHGWAEESEASGRKAVVKLSAQVQPIDGKYRLVLVNYAGKPDSSQKGGWDPVAPDSGKGLGMVAGVLTNLGLGEIIEHWSPADEGNQSYAVAVHMHGLELAPLTGGQGNS
jgi:hypothetical protein